jgi:lipoprotein-anchoring transpeptidase ErfK/SrfK
MSIDRRIRVAVLGVVLVVIAVLGVGVTVSLGRCPSGCPAGSASVATAPSPPSAPAALTVNPPAGAREIDPLARVSVTATSGRLADVVMVNETGSRVVGIMTPDDTVWKPGIPLGYGRSYTLTVTAVGTDGQVARQVSTFSTLTPRNQTKVSLTTTASTPLLEGGTYGIGTIVVAHFDEPITDQAAAERRLTVSTSPPVQGSWYWLDDQNAHWRPERYYAPGTVVTARANIYGAPLGNGLYGQEDTAVRFTIGDAHVSIADDLTKQVSVYDNDVLVRTMPTSMGMGGTETIGGQTLSFWTQRGIYTVMDKANPVIMDSSTYGLPINSRLGYRETIKYATRISTDGIYLHQLESTVWAQGNTNVSHGCLNLPAVNRCRCGRTAIGVCRGISGLQAARCRERNELNDVVGGRRQAFTGTVARWCDVTIRSWSWPQWMAAVVGAVVVSAVLGVPTGLIATPFYIRMTAAPGWSYVVWLATSVLSGLLIATYVRRPSVTRSPTRVGVAANVGSMLAVGCPACNKLVVATVGMGGALNVWAPLQPIVAAVSLVLLGWALRRRCTLAATCALPHSAEVSATGQVSVDARQADREMP